MENVFFFLRSGFSSNPRFNVEEEMIIGLERFYKMTV